MKFAWLTDIHLNFLDEKQRVNFYQEIVSTNSDAILITGDIAEAPTIAPIMKEMSNAIQKPIYFVLGNHDYYHATVNSVRTEMVRLTKTNSLLYWLPAWGSQRLDQDTILLGQDGWADGRLGDYFNSRLTLNDSKMIIDLLHQAIIGKNKLLDKMQQLADYDAKQLENDLKKSLQQHPKKIIVLTHIPPFKEVCIHKGKICDDDYLPYFSSKATGDVLMHNAKENPTIKFLVLAGHTHSESIYKVLPNLTVKVGKAEYLKPEIQDAIYIVPYKYYKKRNYGSKSITF